MAAEPGAWGAAFGELAQAIAEVLAPYGQILILARIIKAYMTKPPSHAVVAGLARAGTALAVAQPRAVATRTEQAAAAPWTDRLPELTARRGNTPPSAGAR